jgi:dienelactone hydrolase
MDVIAKSISYPAGDINVPGFLCLPRDLSASPAVIILHGSDGFGPNHEKIVRKLTAEGFAALAVSWFGGTSARSHWRALRVDDILQAVAFLERQSNIDADKLGLIGFSRGGGLAEFDHLSLNQSEPLDFIQNVSCPVLSFHGKQDTVVPVENTIELDAACKKYGVDHRYVLYSDVNHSFVWPGDKYNSKAHLNSWELTLAFYKAHLK